MESERRNAGPDSGELSGHLADLWRRVRRLTPDIDVPRIPDDSSSGSDFVAWLDLVQQELGVELLPAQVLGAGDITQLAQLVRCQSRDKQLPLLVALTAGHTGIPIVFIAGSDGTFARTSEIVREIPGHRPVYGFEAPGIRRGERPVMGVRALAEIYAEKIRRSFGSQPIVLIGLCFGGTVAHEVVNLLEREGMPPKLLILGDTPAPAAARKHRSLPTQLYDRWRRFVGICSRRGSLGARMLLVRRTSSVGGVRHCPGLIATPSVLLTSKENRDFYGCDDLGWGPFLSDATKCISLPGGHFDVLRFNSGRTWDVIEDALPVAGAVSKIS